MQAAITTKRVGSALDRQSGNLSTYVQTLNDVTALLPECVQITMWIFYVVLGPLFALFANLFMLRSIYVLGFSYATVVFALLVCFSDIVASAFYIWAVTGRLHGLKKGEHFQP